MKGPKWSAAKKHFCVEICFQGNSVPESSVRPLLPSFALLCLRGDLKLKPYKVCIDVWPVCNCEYVRGRLTVRVSASTCVSVKERVIVDDEEQVSLVCVEATPPTHTRWCIATCA